MRVDEVIRQLQREKPDEEVVIVFNDDRTKYYRIETEDFWNLKNSSPIMMANSKSILLQNTIEIMVVKSLNVTIVANCATKRENFMNI